MNKKILVGNMLMVLCALFALMFINGFLFRHYGMDRMPEEMEAVILEYGYRNRDKQLTSFMLNGLASSLAIGLLCYYFTRKLTAKIMNPVQKLMEGAKRVEQADLSQQIAYEGYQEFETLCGAFNNMQASLQAYEKARTDMIAGISHDLRTPLTSVKGFIKGMLDGVADTPEKREQYLSIAYKKACDMDVLINKLFFFSKLETGNLPITTVDTDLAGLIGRFAKETGEEYDVDIPFTKQEGEYPVRIDPDNTKRVLSNLIDNAIKYADIQPLQVQMRLSRESGHAVLAVVDNGQGVPSGKLPHLFERFYQADESRRQNEGSGLGLYIVKYIVEAQGGRVSAENDGGLKIIIRIPLRKD